MRKTGICIQTMRLAATIWLLPGGWSWSAHTMRFQMTPFGTFLGGSLTVQVWNTSSPAAFSGSSQNCMSWQIVHLTHYLFPTTLSSTQHFRVVFLFFFWKGVGRGGSFLFCLHVVALKLQRGFSFSRLWVKSLLFKNERKRGDGLTVVTVHIFAAKT